MKVTQTDQSPGDERERPPAEVARLLDVAGRTDNGIGLYDGRMTPPDEARHAEATPEGLTCCELESALELGSQGPGGEPA